MGEPLNVVMNEAAGRFETTLEDETAFAEYKLHERTLVLPHTLVPESLGGKGIGSALAEAALSYARANDLKVYPSCPFIKAYIKKHPEHLDLIEPSVRIKLAL
jgi:predicted GNAT family acetyltransferase